MPQRHHATKNHKGRFKLFTSDEERIGKAIVNAAFNVHETMAKTKSKKNSAIKLSATLCLSALVAISLI